MKLRPRNKQYTVKVPDTDEYGITLRDEEEKPILVDVNVWGKQLNSNDWEVYFDGITKEIVDEKEKQSNYKLCIMNLCNSTILNVMDGIEYETPEGKEVLLTKDIEITDELKAYYKENFCIDIDVWHDLIDDDVRMHIANQITQGEIGKYFRNLGMKVDELQGNVKDVKKKK